MIITCIHGGLGNQLFMYACGYAAARRLGTELILDASYLDTQTLRDFELNKLNIKYDKLFSTGFLRYYPLKVAYRKAVHTYWKFKYGLIDERSSKIIEEDLFNISDNTFLKGYWATEKYFVECREDILKMISPSYEVSQGCKQFINVVKESNSVSVHVRRGDRVKIEELVDISYFMDAFHIMETHISNPVYYIFSDDIEYSKNLFGSLKGTFVYVEYKTKNSTIEDLMIMKSCKNAIIANSTYSWWGAWLNNNPSKIVVCPIKPGYEVFYPINWIQIKGF